jgi:aryl-alcohol dehydrogenase-like predicted oxidoreductase
VDYIYRLDPNALLDPHVPIEETMEALHDLVKMGKVRYIGASSTWTYQFAIMEFCAERNGWTTFVSMQGNYSLLYREEEREMNKFCDKMGVGLIPWGLLRGGHLARPAKDHSTIRAKDKVPIEQDIGIIDRVDEVAPKKGYKMSQIALTWINQRVASPISSFSNTEMIDEALAANHITLNEDQAKYLEELYKPRAVRGHSNWKGKLAYRK